MSAFVVDRTHVSYLAATALSVGVQQYGGMTWAHNGMRREIRQGDYEGAANLAQELWNENIESVLTRYPDCRASFPRGLPGPVNEDYVIRLTDIRPVLDLKAADIFKACDCYEYQSCEHDGWPSSEAKAYLEAMRKRAACLTPGYEEAAWGAPESYAAQFRAIKISRRK